MLLMASFRQPRKSSCDPMQHTIFEINEILIETVANFSEKLFLHVLRQ